LYKLESLIIPRNLLPFFATEWFIFFTLNITLILLKNPLDLINQTTELIVLIILSWGISSLISDVYKHERTLIYTKTAVRSLLFSILYPLFLSLFLFLFEIPNYLINTKPYLLILCFIIIFLTRVLSFTIVRLLRKKHSVFQKKVFVIESKKSEPLIEYIESNSYTGYKNIAIAPKFLEYQNFGKLKKTISELEISVIFIPIEKAFDRNFQHMLDLKWEKNLNIQLYANYDYPVKNAYVDYFGLVQSFPYRSSPLEIDFNRTIKKLFDLFFSFSIILLILSWMLPIIALLIKIDSKGPVFFIQKRNGLNNKVFRCFKFRSMTENNDLTQVKKNDKRITRIGKILRRTSIDEFPQFINVLKGDMSVVGPRPHMEIHNVNYSKHLKNTTHPFQQRHSIKPGITGLAQVRGFRGEIKGESDIINRVKYDIFYVKHWTFILDIKIILRTAINLIRGEEKAY
jgi:putative colanic acid biosynthesis UDP-glucose lipid carrier transferase